MAGVRCEARLRCEQPFGSWWTQPAFRAAPLLRSRQDSVFRVLTLPRPQSVFLQSVSLGLLILVSCQRMFLGSIAHPPDVCLMFPEAVPLVLQK